MRNVRITWILLTVFVLGTVRAKEEKSPRKEVRKSLRMRFSTRKKSTGYDDDDDYDDYDNYDDYDDYGDYDDYDDYDPVRDSEEWQKANLGQKITYDLMEEFFINDHRRRHDSFDDPPRRYDSFDDPLRRYDSFDDPPTKYVYDDESDTEDESDFEDEPAVKKMRSSPCTRMSKSCMAAAKRGFYILKRFIWPDKSTHSGSSNPTSKQEKQTGGGPVSAKKDKSPAKPKESHQMRPSPKKRGPLKPSERPPLKILGNDVEA